MIKINVLRFKLTILTIALVFIGELNAREKFVGQIPNGAVYKCATCHTSPQGGGSRNTFGKNVGQFIVSGNVKWGAQIAAMDSDNDGFANGLELGDPKGEWVAGKPSPGNKNDLSKPWDPSSKPPATAVEAMEYVNSILTYPNPVVNNVNINFTLSAAMPVRFDIYNALGELVFSSPDYLMSEGENAVSWDTADNNGSPLVAGQYILAIRTGQKFTSGIIVITR